MYEKIDPAHKTKILDISYAPAAHSHMLLSPAHITDERKRKRKLYNV